MMRKLGNLFCWTGWLLIAAALVLTIHNIRDDYHAKDHSREVVKVLQEESKEQETVTQITVDNSSEEEQIPDYELNPEMDMPEKVIVGEGYIGVLNFTDLSLELPVMSDWDYPKLKEAPCRYYGSAYQNNLVIMAHNFQSHFGKIGSLPSGSMITFTDADGNVFSYQVVLTEILAPTEVEAVKSGEWDLTLFTCTTGGSYRVTVRCERI